ncbi:alpha/beta hydrolase [Shewanella schlegeliana]|uniref:Alpha/beta fold hydrolase n=1 Tax=Shewanella schlegeliana TaxID=190308 RepID=A0ABS1T3Y6_9GAMM|nr:alpha/beta hydrolase [Shewanella schlegeliana]MBL4915414.1 alpha/beta fold hydrolase [Shewanella schlegeliana]MCL1110062.1 alpha/beta hydrolase [Shewanella schlegeliana]GIU25005.1 transporter [Shewanella schlegeliana]
MLHGMYSQLRARVAPALWRKKPLATAFLLGAGLLIPSAQADTSAKTLQSNSNNQQACYVDGLSEQMQCGFILVPENYAKPDGKQIEIHYVVMPAIKPSDKVEALLAIAGGPGQSAIENAQGFDRMLSKVRQTQDVILIDQRGTGQSNQLQCVGDGFDSALAVNESDFDTRVETQKCLDTLDADVTQYGSLNALKDFEAIRQHLGYQKLHLYGVSYGTRMAQLYMRHYPQSLATVTLDGVVPMQQSVLAIGNAIARAFDLLIEDCANNRLCHGQFPQLRSDLEKVDAELTQGPKISQVPDPLTGEMTQLTLTRSKFKGALRMALYSPSTRSLMPHAIHQAAKGNYQPITGLYAMGIDNTGIAMGMHASVVCGEDWQRLTPELRAKTSESYFGKEMLKTFSESCAVWNMPAVDASFSEPIDSAIPTLLLSGELDPATPPSWGELAMEKLSNAKHFIAPYATHGVAYQSCGNDLIAQLVEQGSVAELDAECLNEDIRRNFYLNASTVEAIPSDTTEPKEQTALIK